MERDYKDLKACEICQKAFGLTRIRHKCKRCNFIVCADCCKAKAIIISMKEASKETHKVCNLCREDINYQNEIKTTFRTSWANLSDLAKQWVANTNVYQELSLDPENDFNKYLDESMNNEQLKSLIEDLLSDLSQGRADRESFNYSMLEFLHYSQQGAQNLAHRKNVENVLRAYYARYPNQGYVSLLIPVTVELLAFADEKTAFYLLCYLSEKIVPENFWNMNADPLPFAGLLKQKYVMEQASKAVLNPSNSAQVNLKPFLLTFKKTANSLIGGLMADVVNFSTVTTIWNEMFRQKSFRPVQNAIIKIIKNSKTYFEQFSDLTLYNYRLFVCRCIHPSGLKSDIVTQLYPQDEDKYAQEFETTVLPEAVKNHEVLNNSLNIFRELTPEDYTVVCVKVKEIVQNLRIQKKLNINFAYLTQPTFISVLKSTPTLGNYSDEELGEIFTSLDLHKEEAISSRVLVGLLALLISNDLSAKLNEVFAIFDVSGSKKLSPNDMPAVLGFLGEVLPVLNEADATYINFNVHLYEMLEKLRRKVQTIEHITPQDFQLILSKYPVFKIVTGEARIVQRRSDSIVSFISMGQSNLDLDSEQEEEDRNLDDLEEVLNNGEESPNIIQSSPEKIEAEDNSKSGSKNSTEVIENAPSDLSPQKEPRSPQDFEIIKNEVQPEPEVQAVQVEELQVEKEEEEEPKVVEVEELPKEEENIQVVQEEKQPEGISSEEEEIIEKSVEPQVVAEEPEVQVQVQEEIVSEPIHVPVKEEEPQEQLQVVAVEGSVPVVAVQEEQPQVVAVEEKASVQEVQEAHVAVAVESEPVEEQKPEVVVTVEQVQPEIQVQVQIQEPEQIKQQEEPQQQQQTAAVQVEVQVQVQEPTPVVSITNSNQQIIVDDEEDEEESQASTQVEANNNPAAIKVKMNSRNRNVQERNAEAAHERETCKMCNIF